MNSFIPKTKHALIKITKIILNTNEDITHLHVEKVKDIVQKHLNNGWSPSDIKKHYNIEYSDFGMFIKKSLNLKLLNVKDSINNYFKKVGRSVTDEKTLYYKACSFSFDPYSIPNIPGYEKLLQLGLYHPLSNPDGVCRDHMVSIAYGWRNNISPEIISNPCNCQYITNIQNITKNDKSCLTIDELLTRIQNSDLSPVINNARFLAKASEHKTKISETNKLYKTITNGFHNLRILKTDEIPSGYRQGLTRKNKMVGAEGLEPPILSEDDFESPA